MTLVFKAHSQCIAYYYHLPPPSVPCLQCILLVSKVVSGAKDVIGFSVSIFLSLVIYLYIYT